MISGIGGFSAYPILPGGHYPSRDGVGAAETQIADKQEQDNKQISGAKILGADSDSSSAAQATESQQNNSQNSSDSKEKQNLPADERSASGEELTEEEKKQVQELKKRDAEVRAHEQAHLAAAGSLAQGGASFDYQSGPDGGRYAVGGEVSIDTSKVANDPAATITKAQRIRRAALAPAEPSSTDRAVAASAASMEAQARKELAQENQQEFKVEANSKSAAAASKSAGESKADGSKTANSAPPGASSITDFYKNIQASSSSASQGVSQLDIFA